MSKAIEKLEDAKVPAALAEEYAKDAEGNLEGMGDAYFKVTTGGSRFKVNDALIGDNGTEFRAVILAKIPVNVFYKEKFDPANPSPPDCCSVGGSRPDSSVEAPQSSDCAGCPQNQFGSGKDQDGNPSRGKACNNTMRLVLKVEGVDLPVMMTLPSTSAFPSKKGDKKGTLKEYLKDLSGAKVPVPMFAVETVFSFDSSADVTYPKPQVGFSSFLSEGQYKEMKALRETPATREVLHAFASGEEVASDEGATDEF